MAAALPFIIIGITAMGSIMQGQQASQQASSQGQISQFNADASRQQAQVAGQIGAANEADARRKGALFLGSQAAALGESGIGLEGSVSDVMKQSATFAAIDALNKRYEGQIQKRGLVNQSISDQYGADTYGRNASSSMYGGFLGAGTSILSGVSKYGQVTGKF